MDLGVVFLDHRSILLGDQLDVPIANASAIIQALPLAVTLGATLFLKEPGGWRRLSAISVGLIGMLIIVRPPRKVLRRRRYR